VNQGDGNVTTEKAESKPEDKIDAMDGKKPSDEDSSTQPRTPGTTMSTSSAIARATRGFRMPNPFGGNS